MTINQARIRDGVTAAAIILSVVLFFRAPAIWINDFVDANPYISMSIDIILKDEIDNFLAWHIEVPLMMYVGFFAAKAKSFLEGFALPMAFTLVFLLIFRILAWLLASIFLLPPVVWIPYIIVFNLCSVTYFWLVPRLFKEHLDLSGSLTEFVCAVGPMVLGQLMMFFVEYLFR